jgi:acetylornithine deacetylase/succinyl-diaminopimelate desuccinylase-like protein
MVRNHLRGEDLRRLADELAFPRRAGSEGSERIVGLVAGRLRQAGLEVSVEPFGFDLAPARRALQLLLLGCALLVGGAGLVVQRWPLAAPVLVAAAVAPALVFLAWAPWLERLYASDGPTRTANVVGRRPVVDPRLTLVVMAHHDSKSQSLSLAARLGLTGLALGAVVVLTALAVAAGAAVGSEAGSLARGAQVAAGIGVVALGALALMRSGDGSPGGVDNAGSLAVVLELARVLPGEIADDVELVVLATGAEEDHMVGAMRWLDHHLDGLGGRPVYCVNLDGAGAPGRAVLIERYGLGRPFSRRMSEAARRAAAWLDIPVRGILMFPGLGIDAIPFAHRGVPCLTLASGSIGRAVLAVHSRRDVAGNLDPAALQRVAALARSTLHELARTTPRSET